MLKLFNIIKQHSPRITHNNKLWDWGSRNAMAAGAFFCISLVCLPVLYLMLTNHIATKGFAIKELEQVMSELTKATQSQEVKIAQLQSNATLLERIDILHMTETTFVEYVSPDTSVAYVVPEK